MPKSKVRKKNDFTVNSVSRTPVKVKVGPSSVWFVVLFIGLMLIGLVWLLVFAAGSWRARPRLAITAAGLVYRGWFRTVTLRRPDIELIRITEFRRLGRSVRLLEIDTVEAQLIVLSRWDLGGDPLKVLDALTGAGYVRR